MTEWAPHAGPLWSTGWMVSGIHDCVIGLWINDKLMGAKHTPRPPGAGQVLRPGYVTDLTPDEEAVYRLSGFEAALRMLQERCRG